MLAVIILVSKIKTQLSRDHLRWYGTPVINVNKCIFQSKYSHWFSGTVTYIFVALTHCVMLLITILGEKPFIKFSLILLLISIRSMSQYEGVPYHFNNRHATCTIIYAL